MNTNYTKNYSNSLYRKKEYNPSKLHEKLKKRNNRYNSISIERNHSPENKNKYLFNTLYKKRLNNSIDRLNISSIKKKNINLKKNNINKNYLYNKLSTYFAFYNLNYTDLNFDLNDIIYFTEESTLYKGKYFHNDVCIKEEYMKNKSLKLFIESNKGNISLKQKLLFIYEIALGIEYMITSNYKILHRDIKSSNILLDDNLHCKICDFGMSKCTNINNNSDDNNTNNMSTNYQTNSQSTLFWMSPEYLCEGIINDKCDIYSFGILIWEIFMEDTNPYKNININDYFLGNKDK